MLTLGRQCDLEDLRWYFLFVTVRVGPAEDDLHLDEGVGLLNSVDQFET